jgi:hypothetical protein
VLRTYFLVYTHYILVIKIFFVHGCRVIDGKL